MSRHRDIRCMKYSDEYDGYDDVYGHSVEDDYCISPGAEQFIYDRNKSSFLSVNEDGEASTIKKPELPELETAKLMSCIESIRNIIGKETISDNVLVKKIIDSNFNSEAVLDEILNDSGNDELSKTSSEQSATSTGFSESTMKKLSFKIPKLSTSSELQTEPKPSFNSLSELTKHHLQNATKKPSPTFNSLSDLTANHLQGSSKPATSKFHIPKLGGKFSKPNNSFSDKLLELRAALKTESKGEIETVNEGVSELKITGEPSMTVLTSDLKAVGLGDEEKVNLSDSDLEAKIKTFVKIKRGDRKLHLTRNDVSPLGKVLCRRFCSQKIKFQAQCLIKDLAVHDNVKRFDFSTPSPDSIILTRLNRK